MKEEGKLRRLLACIAKCVYTLLIVKESPITAALFTQHCRTFEALKTGHLMPMFGRFTNVTDDAAVNFGDNLPAIIRRIVREGAGSALQHSGQTAYHCVHTMPTHQGFPFQTSEFSETQKGKRFPDQQNSYLRRTEVSTR